MAEGLAGLGLIAEALSAVDKGLASADQGGERFYYPELLRLKGELLLRQPRSQHGSDGERCLQAARRLVRRHGALALELRSVMSLTRLRVIQDQHEEARRILRALYNQFTEGFDTTDLKAAELLLATLG